MSSTGEPVLNAATQTLDCGGCGTHETVQMTMALDALAKKLLAFARTHKRCAKRYAK